MIQNISLESIGYSANLQLFFLKKKNKNKKVSLTCVRNQERQFVYKLESQNHMNFELTIKHYTEN